MKDYSDYIQKIPKAAYCRLCKGWMTERDKRKNITICQKCVKIARKALK